MTKFSIPENAMPNMTQLEQMNKDINALLPHDAAGAVNMMAHPMAGFAAASALGLGVASHAYGLWLGVAISAAEATQRLFEEDRDAAAKDAFRTGAASSTRVRAAAETLMADAQQTAKELADASAVLARTSGAEAAGAPDSADAAGLMPEDFRQPKGMKKPAAPDDLKAISGVGPKLETVLNGLGVWTYGQIAAWQPEEIAWVDDYLSFKGRISRDGWLEQAATLAENKK